MYIIQDWASNVLNKKGLFEYTAYGQRKVTFPMQFESFDDAELYLEQLLKNDYENDRGEYYIEERE